MLPSKKSESDILCGGNAANRTGNLLSLESKHSTSKRLKHILMKPSWVKTPDFRLGVLTSGHLLTSLQSSGWVSKLCLVHVRCHYHLCLPRLARLVGLMEIGFDNGRRLRRRHR